MPNETPLRCPRCRGTGWVCDAHPERQWGSDPWCCDCGAEGAPCVCKPAAWMPPGTLIVAEIDEEPPKH